MKYSVLLFTLLLCFHTFSQRKPKIKGTRNVIEVVEELEPFNAIELNDDLEVFLEKSAAESCVINADDNLIDVLKFKVVDSILVINSFYKITSKKKLDIKINYFGLNAITLRDGKVNMKDVISSDTLNVHTSGSSRLVINANADVMNVEMEDISSGDFNIVSNTLSFAMKNRTDAGISAVSGTTAITMEKNASAKMEGNTNEFSIDLSDHSYLRAEKFEAENIISFIRASSRQRINASANLKLNSTGAAKTTLSGNSKIEILDFLNTSQLYKTN